MAIEIERKFLVHPDKLPPLSCGTLLKQGYLNLDPDRTVRIRVAGEEAWMTIKGITNQASRLEYEYSIPVQDAVELLDKLCLHLIEKTRYQHPAGLGLVWEIDVFHGLNAPLIVAEIELPSLDISVEHQEWLGEEVTSDARYYNSQLAAHPYQFWS